MKLRNIMKQIIAESVNKSKLNEDITDQEMRRNAQEIANKTGTRVFAVIDFIEKNNLDSLQIVMDLGQKKLKAMDFATAISGNPDNKYAQAIIAKYQN